MLKAKKGIETATVWKENCQKPQVLVSVKM